ncbi:MAG: Panacea domain-containing protein [Helicobacteraceae bacterium]
MKAINLAKYVINYSIKMSYPVSNLQLQKILYFLNLFFCKKYGDFLIDDNFEAWKYGPVISEVYQEYSIYGGNAITIRQDGEDGEMII